MNKEELKLLNEMKDNCLNGAKYIDPKSMEKYNLLRKIEDRLNNWNELKKWLKEEMKEYKKDIYPSQYGWMIGTMKRTLNKMQEIESGSNE